MQFTLPATQNWIDLQKLGRAIVPVDDYYDLPICGYIADECIGGREW